MAALTANAGSITCICTRKTLQVLINVVRWRRDGSKDVSKWDGERFVNEKPHLETPEYPGLFSGELPAKGRIYDKKPFRMLVEAGKTYRWCSCGMSRSQPFCDKTHFYEEGPSRIKSKPRMRPVVYVAKETKYVYFCNCKQTNNRPFCDGTHNQQDIQEATSIFKN